MNSNNKDRLLNQLGEQLKSSRKLHRKSEGFKVQKPVILVIDDQLSMLEYAETVLTDAGYYVHTTQSVAEGRRILQANLSISMVLTDLRMPNEDGYALLEFVKSNMRFSHIPVIVVTSNANPDFVVKALKMGAKDYLTKPYRSKTLIDRVEKIFESIKVKILLVVSDTLELSLLKRSFSSKNTKLTPVIDGAEAVEILKSNTFDVIIADFILKDMTGIDFLENIIDLEIQTPVIFVEFHGIKITEEMIRSVGGHGLIRKPFNNNEILKILRTVLGDRIHSHP